MQAVKLICPHCRAVLRSPKPLPDGARLKCVTCQQLFQVQSGMQSQSTAASYAGGDYKLPAETLDFLNDAADASGPRPLVRVQRPRRGVGGIVFLCLFLLLAGGGTAAVLILTKEKDPASSGEKAKKKSDPVQVAGGPGKKASELELPKKLALQEVPKENPKPAVDKDGPPPLKIKKEVPPIKVKKDPDDPVMKAKPEKQLPPLDPKKVNEAIDRGVAYLKAQLGPTGNWSPQEKFNPVGHAALPALALLECGVPANDPTVQSAARHVRQNALKTEETYCIGCVILFLDRLNDPADRPLIRHLALRLAAGQNSSGAWGYQCPEVSLDERENLHLFLEQNRPKIELFTAIVAVPDLPMKPRRKTDKEPPPEEKPAPPPRKPRLSKRLADLPVVQFQKKQVPGQLEQKRGDNSNTQFAILGLWAARKHGIAAEASLEFAAEHFRKTANGNGGWGYATGTPTKNTMTSVGLLSLAMGHGAAAEKFQEFAAKNGKAPRPPIDDKHIKMALTSLAQYLDGGDKEIRGLETRHDLYLYWAIERVGVLFQFETIGKTDWYPWAAREILSRQGADGGWEEHYHAAIDTSFALLVLKRSNLVSNLTESLQNYMIIDDSHGRRKRR